MWGSTPSPPAPTRASTVPAITFEPTRSEPSLAAGSALSVAAASVCLRVAVGPVRQRPQARAQVLAFDREPLLLAGRHHDQAVVADDLTQFGVGVAVAVGVFEDDELAELAASCRACG